MTKKRILAIAKKVKNFYDYMEGVDTEIEVCGYGHAYKPQVHIYSPKDIDEIAKIMGMEVKINTEMEHKELIIGGVKFFSIWSGE